MYDELTEVDIQKMKDEIDYRTLQLRPKLIEEVKVARGFGDLSENFEYKAAKREKNRNDSRIRYLQRMVDTAKVISDHSSGDVVGLFDKVIIYIPDDDEEQTIRLVTTLRQNALEGLISKESPVGKAVMGHRAGETVHVQVNENVGYDIVIRSVEKAGRRFAAYQRVLSAPTCENRLRDSAAGFFCPLTAGIHRGRSPSSRCRHKTSAPCRGR